VFASPLSAFFIRIADNVRIFQVCEGDKTDALVVIELRGWIVQVMLQKPAYACDIHKRQTAPLPTRQLLSSLDRLRHAAADILRIIEEVRTAADTADVINQLHSKLSVSQCHRYEQGELRERKPPPKQL